MRRGGQWKTVSQSCHLPGWFCVLLLLVRREFEFPQPTKAVHGRLLAGLACETERNLLRCFLASPEQRLHTANKSFLFPIVSTPAEGDFALFTTTCLSDFVDLMLLAKFAEELLSLGEVHHRPRGKVGP
jgi:hypothetical protein